MTHSASPTAPPARSHRPADGSNFATGLTHYAEDPVRSGCGVANFPVRQGSDSFVVRFGTDPAAGEISGAPRSAGASIRFHLPSNSRAQALLTLRGSQRGHPIKVRRREIIREHIRTF
jgi:hypothetical protein